MIEGFSQYSIGLSFLKSSGRSLRFGEGVGRSTFRCEFSPIGGMFTGGTARGGTARGGGTGGKGAGIFILGGLKEGFEGWSCWREGFFGGNSGTG